jgi:hypothetical protein
VSVARSLRPVAGAWMAGAVLAVVMTWPMMSAPGSLTRLDTHDGKFSVWNVAWVAHALTTDPLRVFDANIFHPHTGTLAYSEANLVAGLVAAPIYALTGNPVLSHNLVVFVALTAAFGLMWQLVRRLTGSIWAGYPPAAAFAFSAYVSAHTAHIQLLLVFVVPMVLLLWHHFVDAPGVRRGAWLGLGLTFSVLACAYYGIMMGLAVGFATLWWAVRHPAPRTYWTGIATAFVVAMVSVAPIAVPYATLRDEQGLRSELNLDEARSYSADHRTYMRGHGGVLTRVLPDATRSTLNAYVGRNGEVLFPGLVTLALAGFALVWIARGCTPDERRTQLFYVALVVVAVWASLGPRAGLYVWLADVIPFMSFLRAPARFGVLTLGALAVLAGIGLAALSARRRHAALIAIAVTVVTAAELHVRWPLRPVPPLPAAYQMLAQLQKAGTLVLHFPYRSGEWFPHAEYMFWSSWHWQPMVNGYSDYIPQDVVDLAVPVNGFPDAASMQILRERQVRYVVIDWRTYNDAAQAVMHARLPPFREYVRPLFDGEDVSLYEIVGWPD